LIAQKERDRILGSRNALIFLEVKNRIVGPLSESKISDSGFFIGGRDRRGSRGLDQDFQEVPGPRRI
jgi:hypothetical protein